MREKSLAELKEFYQVVDEQTARLAETHGSRLNCKRGCSRCCVDDLTVWSIEAENIRRFHGDLLANDSPGEAGACAFLDAGGSCRIYENRPYVCRTQGLPLRWLEEIDDEIYEMRDVCPLNEAGEPVEAIAAEDCWEIGDAEEKLARLEIAFGGEMKRIRLRSLFAEMSEPGAAATGF